MTSVDIITADLSKQVGLRLHDILNKISPHNINMACITWTKSCQTDKISQFSRKDVLERFDHHFLISQIMS